MSDVTGPISSLPGAMHIAPKGAKCDIHPDREAVVRIQGETDSFGAEMHDWCKECHDKYKQEEKLAYSVGVCDWCHTEKPNLRPKRDYEEGLYGPVYYVCSECSRKYDSECRRKYDNEFFDEFEE